MRERVAVHTPRTATPLIHLLKVDVPVGPSVHNIWERMTVPSNRQRVTEARRFTRLGVGFAPVISRTPPYAGQAR